MKKIKQSVYIQTRKTESFVLQVAFRVLTLLIGRQEEIRPVKSPTPATIEGLAIETCGRPGWLAGGYNYDSTALRSPFDSHSTAVRPLYTTTREPTSRRDCCTAAEINK